jgi:hypothetical protein
MFIKKTRKQGTVETPRYRRKDNIYIQPGVHVDWIQLAQDSVQWRRLLIIETARPTLPCRVRQMPE